MRSACMDLCRHVNKRGVGGHKLGKNILSVCVLVSSANHIRSVGHAGGLHEEKCLSSS